MSVKKCKYCDEPRSSAHMFAAHPDIVAKYRRYINETDEKIHQFKRQEEEIPLLWRKQIYGNRIG